MATKKKAKKKTKKKMVAKKKIVAKKKPQPKKKAAPKKKHKPQNGGVAPAPWCQDFPASPGDLCDFTGYPANACIDVPAPGDYWPFCGANNTLYGPPICFIDNAPVYIKSDARSGPWPFLPSPVCKDQTTKTVTIS
jgi:hypothetical protein